MIPLKILGYILIALPFAVIGVYSLRTLGMRQSLIVLSLVVSVIALIGFGMHLIYL